MAHDRAGEADLDGLLRTSFLRGIARVLDIGAMFEPPDLSDPPANDAEAIRSDWSAVVADLAAAKRAR